MKHKSTLLLFIAVVVAALVAYSLSRKPTSEQTQQQQKRVLSGYSAGKVATVSFQEGDQRITCQREEGSDGGWRIAEPVQVRGERWAIEDILDQLERAEKVSTVRAEKGRPLDLATYGLDKSVRTVTLAEKAGGRTWKILIGKDAGAADAVWITLEGDPAVYSVRKSLAEKMAVSLTGLRSKSLAPRIPFLDLKEATISGTERGTAPAFEVQCARSGRRWEIKAPFYDLADEDRLEQLAAKVHDHRIGAGDFVVDDPTKASEYGLDRPMLTLTLKAEGKSQTVVFSFHEADGANTCYAMLQGEPAIVRVPATLFDDVRRSATDLRNTSLVGLPVYDVGSVEVTGPQGPLSVKKSGDAWQIAGEQPAAADKQVTERFLTDLKAIRVERFVADQTSDLAPYGLTEQQRMAVTLKGPTGEAAADVHLGGTDPGGELVYAMRPPYPAVLAVRKQDCLDRLRTGRVAFLNLVVVEERGADPLEVAVQRGGASERAARENAAEGWKLQEPVQAPADQDALDAIVGDLTSLRAESIVAEKADDLTPFGLDRPEIVVNATYQPKAAKENKAAPPAVPEKRTRTVQVGLAAQQPPGSRYARLDGDSRVFVLGERFLAHFNAGLASKVVCAEVGLVGLTFQKDGQTWHFRYDKETKAWTDDQGQAAPALEAIAGLLRDFRAVQVAEYTEKSPSLYGFDQPYLAVEIESETARGKKIVVGNETEDGKRFVKGPSTGFVLVAGKADMDALLAALEPPKPAVTPLAGPADNPPSPLE
jgi:hypothetical protein